MRATAAAVAFLLVGTSAAAQLPARQGGGATESAVFAAGCFWCSELAFQQIQGVIDVESGYCGGTAKTANYWRVHRGTTRHAEAVRVTYDPAKVSYDQLLDVFFAAHDPTQKNRQGEDVGRQYRSAIFFADDQQKRQAESKIGELAEKKVYRRRIVTTLEPSAEFFPAEFAHQNFALRNFNSNYIQAHAVPRACNVRNMHPELIAPGK
jgi:methionine-S-sulfoxide reductase